MGYMANKAPAKEKALGLYRAKRNFSLTPEPAAKVKKSSPKSKERLFVIQKHAARNLHYDFRLEIEGVLRSWAVPKGPPLQQGEKRLAMHVEDHPMGYAKFEGIIPQGQYGGGTVMVWDIGTYSVPDNNPTGSFYAGKLSLELHGKKLKGEWTLVRTGRGEEDAGNKWLLIKTGEEHPPISERRENKSALTGRSMEQIAADKKSAK
jgi:bifunctional non-homologous end joining protein LigD